MWRSAINHLFSWKKSQQHKPLLLRGARQVGKTYLVRKLGTTFDDFIEVNFELTPKAIAIFNPDLNPKRILYDLGLLFNCKIEPGKTLLFLDEIQECPKAMASLRYFYEMMPNLHVIAAGSLLDFAIEEQGIPVGRVTSLYLYPLSFLEFLQAQNRQDLYQLLISSNIEQQVSLTTHNLLNDYIKQYLSIGGMPEVVACWLKNNDLKSCLRVQQSLIDTYRQDFQKYGTIYQLKYLNLLFERIPYELGRKFKYSNISSDYRARELNPCLDLLSKASIVHKICHTSGHSIPLGALAKLNKFKCIFLDVGLSQYMLGDSLTDWLLEDHKHLVHKGSTREAFVGQELMAYSDPFHRATNYYWLRESRGSVAEVDYMIQQGHSIIPLEVKSGNTGTMKSLHLFLNNHLEHTSHGIKICWDMFSREEKIITYPLYAIASLMQVSSD